MATGPPVRERLVCTGKLGLQEAKGKSDVSLLDLTESLKQQQGMERGEMQNFKKKHK